MTGETGTYRVFRIQHLSVKIKGRGGRRHVLRHKSPVFAGGFDGCAERSQATWLFALANRVNKIDAVKINHVS